MPAFRTAGRFIRKQACAFELVCRNVIGGGLQSAGVVSARHTVAAVGAAIENRLKMHSCDGAVLLQTKTRMHQDRMTAAVAIEHFFASKRNLHRASRLHRKSRDRDLMTKRIAFSAKTAAVRTRNDLDAIRRHFQHAGDGTVNVMWRLRCRPERQLAIRLKNCDGSVLLHWQMG